MTAPQSSASVNKAERPANPNAPDWVEVTHVEHWTDSLFSFKVKRPASFRFRSGEFIMLGLEVDGKPLLRAYSVACSIWEEELEFFSIKVPNGPLTSRLQHLKPGDQILLGKKPVGTLVLDSLSPGKRLYMFSTGTGIAPFASVIRDPETYERFDEVILTQTCRERADLSYGYHLAEQVMEDPLVGDEAAVKFRFYASTTREASERQGRITDLIETGQLFSDLGVPPLDPTVDRVMICGSMPMIADTKALLEAAGLSEGAHSRPAEYVVEKAFVG